MLVLSLVLLRPSLGDPQFAAVALAPDNIPIVAMVYLLGFFTWLATAQAVENDRRRGGASRRGRRMRDRKGVHVAGPGLQRTDLHRCW